MTNPQEPQQSPLYAAYMKELHWQVETIDTVNMFVKTFPFRQGIVKIHRPEILPDIQKLIPLFRTYHVKTVVIEPIVEQNEIVLQHWVTAVSKYAKVHTTPFLPTKTIRVDITPSEKLVFQSLSEAKRRAVRRAIKLGVTVVESDNMDDLIKIKNKSAGLFGFITTTGMKPLWEIFSKEDAASILLAYDVHKKLIGGVLLLHWQNITYYWIAGATKHGKKLYAPTLLAWEAIKTAQRKKSALFDFVGVWDERIPKENIEWKGFTKFKEGFNGKNLYYPIPSLLITSN